MRWNSFRQHDHSLEGLRGAPQRHHLLLRLHPSLLQASRQGQAQQGRRRYPSPLTPPPQLPIRSRTESLEPPAKQRSYWSLPHPHPSFVPSGDERTIVPPAMARFSISSARSCGGAPSGEVEAASEVRVTADPGGTLWRQLPRRPARPPTGRARTPCPCSLLS
jgi:hypothetical protein